LNLNTRDRCIVCFKKPESNFVLIKHHVSYFPEVIAFVHYKCHNKIHDPKSPMTTFIQYDNGDSRKFYTQQKESKN